MPFIDVLRAIAILTVIVHHLPQDMGMPFGRLQEWGGRGVDLFFVLSGFLIGSTCLARAGVPGHPGTWSQAKAYWLLRSARILPLYWVLLGVLALGLPIFNPDVAFVLRKWPLPYLTFTSNSFGQGTLELGIFWSLAIEEQFYLAVGLLILFCSSRRDTLAAAFTGLSLAAIAVSLVHRQDLANLRFDGALDESAYIFRLFHSTISRMDQLAVGLLTAVVAPRFNALRLARSARWAGASTWLAIALCLALLVYLPHRPVKGFLLIGLVFAACLLWVQRPAARALSVGRVQGWLLAPLLTVGKLSFGLYVFHAFVRRWVPALLPAALTQHGSLLHASAFVAVWVVATLVIAALSYRFFEEPLNALARRKAKQFVQPLPQGTDSPGRHPAAPAGETVRAAAAGSRAP
jgi:peptidoglycan/LPS O-acetylase OafA/YrhL